MISPIVLLMLLQLVYGRQFDLVPYTQVATSYEGSPCLTGCVNGVCVINWFGTEAYCKTYGLSPKYYTTQYLPPYAVQCLSNCNFFGYPREWCITSYDMHWDYCSSYVRESYDDPVAMTRYGDNCITACSKGGYNYYWCYYLDIAGNEKWEFCAPPADTSNC